MNVPHFPIPEMLSVVESGEAFFDVLTDNPPAEWERVLAISSKSLLWTALCKIQRYDLLKPYMELVAKDDQTYMNILELDTLFDPAVLKIVLDMEREEKFPNAFFAITIRSMINNGLYTTTDWTPLIHELLLIKPQEANSAKLSHLLMTYNIKQNSQSSTSDDQARVRAQAQKMFDALLSHGANIEDPVKFRHKCPNAMGADMITHPNLLDFIIFTMCKDGYNMGEHTLTFLLDQGANWRDALNDPNVAEAGKQILRNQPMIRKALLEEVSAQTPKMEGQPAKPKM